MQMKSLRNVELKRHTASKHSRWAGLQSVLQKRCTKQIQRGLPRKKGHCLRVGRGQPPMISHCSLARANRGYSTVKPCVEPIPALFPPCPSCV